MAMFKRQVAQGGGMPLWWRGKAPAPEKEPSEEEKALQQRIKELI